jgi:hypothetical protein
MGDKLIREARMPPKKKGLAAVLGVEPELVRWKNSRVEAI